MNLKLPPPLSWIWSAWMKFSEIFGKIMSTIILTILWVVGFGLYAIALKIAALFKNKDIPTTYWLDVPTDFEGSMKHQF